MVASRAPLPLDVAAYPAMATRAAIPMRKDHFLREDVSLAGFGAYGEELRGSASSSAIDNAYYIIRHKH